VEAASAPFGTPRIANAKTEAAVARIDIVFFQCSKTEHHYAPYIFAGQLQSASIAPRQ